MSNAIARRIRDLELYGPPLTGRPDLESYWDRTLAEIAGKPLNAAAEKASTPMAYVDAWRVQYEGFDDTRIHGWYLRPRFVEAGRKLPCIVHYHGYTGSKGYPEDFGAYLLMGMAVFSVDVRGQGGETGNRLGQDYGMAKGWITQGILDRDTCYYKAITVDALKAVEWAAAQEDVDAGRICVMGGSQGGGLVMMAAALSNVPALAVAHIPNMCHMDFGMMNSTGSLTEAADFAARFPDRLEQVLKTLSYFDQLNLAHRIRIPILVSCGLKDTITMPETIYAAYNRITAPKEMHAYPFMGHHVGGDQNRRALEFIASRFGL
ncbi:alpha/beta fold hydrolase [Cohnella sp. CFH 77786]|uniref:acetylxylan esterase n=1 Tax=Cohnella sp. CFH 77786 TaxID=2662265 RepID=UPI001C60CF60|nr:alpha/beta fold hydrolase [Cohnella sp. CFH 77786]MBW5447021.1 alpha/beta fold hydrolase [Cohnella sp. CFH 77786]